ncbi:hypothetical protein JOC86_004245 [Bacillus pakistanensis]|uniref:Uncharacterized protein n=1 Tax=Rossellomorea pakistanensis TaxID=992288 RepID=A0ABS2NII0_9BACI|nr:hypothetical protein [Bacillus pakistanensis]MBM7587671.1 hypothetical protein [Bacillus pakistanensis]
MTSMYDSKVTIPEEFKISSFVIPANLCLTSYQLKLGKENRHFSGHLDLQSSGIGRELPSKTGRK